MTPQEAMRENVRNAWDVIRKWRCATGVPPKHAMLSIRGQYEFIWQAYNTPNGRDVSLGERLVLSGAVS
jgi:hypothetical protein